MRGVAELDGTLRDALADADEEPVGAPRSVQAIDRARSCSPSAERRRARYGFGREPDAWRTRDECQLHYQAGSSTRARRVVAKVEWHPGELYPRVGFIVTNMAGPAENVVAFYNKRGTCEQWIKEGKGAIKWTR